jgi:CheY-like chemotaxis protein
MSKIKILCLDDTPDAPEINSRTLREILQSIYADSPYKIVFETNGEKGIKVVKNDKDVKLVLLDIEFTKQKKQGDTLVKDLLKVRPELKVIVLTRLIPSGKNKGKKTSFKWKPNVVHYVVKKELTFPDIQKKLKNLSSAIIDDYTNRNWEIRYDDISVINLTNKQTQKTYGINIPSTSEPALLECMKSPNKPVSLPITYGKNLNRVHNNINENVREKTDWNTWGILTREDCTKGQLKLVIDSVGAFSTSPTVKDPYVTQSYFEKFKRDVEERLKKIESTLNLKSPQENK